LLVILLPLRPELLEPADFDRDNADARHDDERDDDRPRAAAEERPPRPLSGLVFDEEPPPPVDRPCVRPEELERER